MGKKDLIEKRLEDYNDVFADIFNTLLFQKEELLQEQLINGPTVSIYKDAADELREQGRDIFKIYQNSTWLVIASLGIENQTKYDAVIPIRVMGYDYSSYRMQIDQKKPLYPVITLVLNFSKERWENNKSLHQMLKLSNEWKAYVQDYKIHVFDIAFLEDDVIEKFQSDFKMVAQFFKNKRIGKDPFEGNEAILQHAEEFLELLAVFTGDQKYVNSVPAVRKAKEKGEKIKMCWVIESHIERGRKLGLEEGREQAEMLTARMMFRNGLSMGMVSACIQHLTEEQLQKISEEEQKRIGE